MTSPRRAALVLVLLLVAHPRPHGAHQAISYPWPISNDGACRVGKFKNCPGPCPTHTLRLDQTRDSPSVRLRRGQHFEVSVKRNNHAGGFTRWTIVNVRDMYSKKVHDEAAFYYTCGDQQLTHCTSVNRLRDCVYDQRNEYYRHALHIPTIYADGVYVLGFAWFGGTQAPGTGGNFGDYYDCMYIEIKGGPFSKWHQPTFDVAKSATAKHGMCAARTMWLGDCKTEPCTHRDAALRVPWNFRNGKKPKKLHSSAFAKPYRVKRVGNKAPKLYGIVIRDAEKPSKVYAHSKWGWKAKLSLKKNMYITATCEVSGDVSYVNFYRNGELERKEESAPYSIGGLTWKPHKGKLVWKYRAWLIARTNDFYSLSCGVHGKDGSVQIAKLDVQQSV